MQGRINGVTVNDVVSGASDSDDDTSSTPAKSSSGNQWISEMSTTVMETCVLLVNKIKTQERFQKAVKKLDRDNSGKLSFIEFHKCMKKAHKQMEREMSMELWKLVFSSMGKVSAAEVVMEEEELDAVSIWNCFLSASQGKTQVQPPPPQSPKIIPTEAKGAAEAKAAAEAAKVEAKAAAEAKAATEATTAAEVKAAAEAEAKAVADEQARAEEKAKAEAISNDLFDVSSSDSDGDMPF